MKLKGKKRGTYRKKAKLEQKEKEKQNNNI